MLLSGQQFNTEAANTTQIPELGKKGNFPCILKEKNEYVNLYAYNTYILCLNRLPSNFDHPPKYHSTKCITHFKSLL